MTPRATPISGLTAPFHEARAILGVGPSEDAAAIKRAYRRMVAEHPPDSDPEGFRRVRDAYELLSNPVARATDLLRHPLPFAGPPRLAEVKGADPHELSVLLLRRLAGQLDTSALFTEVREP